MPRALFLALALVFAVSTAAVGCPVGDSVELGCKTRDDCPRPEQQTCVVETGTCVGFTSSLGDTDGGDDQVPDGGVLPPPPE